MKQKSNLVSLICIVVLLVTFTVGMASAKGTNQKAIVVASFGTTYDEALKANIESVENAVKAEFPEYEVRRAFTSKIVMKRLSERGIKVDSLEECLTKLQQEGYKEVVVQTTLLTAGEEFDNKIMAVVKKYQQNKAFDKLVVGRPLLYFQGEHSQPDDYKILADALRQQMPVLQMPDKAVVFMGHGSPNKPNPAYGLMQERLMADKLNAAVGVVEENGSPNFDDTVAFLAKHNYKRVILMPLMLVAGDHANNDMAGDEEDSWKSQLIRKGYQVETYLHGLGENRGVQEIYVQHVRDALTGM